MNAKLSSVVVVGSHVNPIYIGWKTRAAGGRLRNESRRQFGDKHGGAHSVFHYVLFIVHRRLLEWRRPGNEMRTPSGSAGHRDEIAFPTNKILPSF